MLYHNPEIYKLSSSSKLLPRKLYSIDGYLFFDQEWFPSSSKLQHLLLSSSCVPFRFYFWWIFTNWPLLTSFLMHIHKAICCRSKQTACYLNLCLLGKIAVQEPTVGINSLFHCGIKWLLLLIKSWISEFRANGKMRL